MVSFSILQVPNLGLTRCLSGFKWSSQGRSTVLSIGGGLARQLDRRLATALSMRHFGG